MFPITHTQPPKGSRAIEIPAPVRRQLDLDGQKSWIVTTEDNEFRWPGFDLKPAMDDRWIFGKLPPAMLRQIQSTFIGRIRSRSIASVYRDEKEDDQTLSKKQE